MGDDKRLERIEVKLDDVGDHLASIDVTLKAQHIILDEHIRRTAALEAGIEPIKKHVNMVKGAAAFLTILAAIAGIVAVFRK